MSYQFTTRFLTHSAAWTRVTVTGAIKLPDHAARHYRLVRLEADGQGRALTLAADIFEPHLEWTGLLDFLLEDPVLIAAQHEWNDLDQAEDRKEFLNNIIKNLLVPAAGNIIYG